MYSAFTQWQFEEASLVKARSFFQSIVVPKLKNRVPEREARAIGSCYSKYGSFLEYNSEPFSGKKANWSLTNFHFKKVLGRYPLCGHAIRSSSQMIY